MLSVLSAAAAAPSVTLNLGSGLTKPSQSIIVILALTLLGVAPSLLILLTGFTRIVIVLGLTRQALGLSNIPPNQVIAGLALFLSLFLMAPTLSQMNKTALQPYMQGKETAVQAYDAAQVPLKQWMLRQTRSQELSMFDQLAAKSHGAGAEAATPKKASQVSLSALIPAFLLSELKSAFIIGFVIFIPFLVIDLVVSSTLMSMGMVMLPPTLVSLPFKLLLFVLVDGWTLVVHSLLVSFR
ncbi:MAG: flagellar type III secretion system pore protein FliP [Acidimicrobiales bacterium]